MANKRSLKKEINFITEELISECLYNQIFTKGANTEENNKILEEIIDIQEDFLRRINITDGKYTPKIVKKYYRALIADFDKKIDAIIDKLAITGKQS